MLNQRDAFTDESGKMYCRIALGLNSQTRFVDFSLKYIVITSKKDTYKNKAIPIAGLNWFERQVTSYYSTLNPDQINLSN